MADVVLYKGGTPDIKYYWTKDTPVVYSPPFGHSSHIRPHTPPFDAHYEAEMGGKATFTAGYPFVPSRLSWQQVNVRAFKPVVGDMLQMIVVPVNHYIQSIRLDVNAEDPGMAGATVDIAGQWIAEDPGDPTRFVVTPSTEIDAAAAAQSGQGISLAVQSSTVIWLAKIDSGYVAPLYVPPQFITPPSPNNVLTRYQGGGLILGLKISALPTGGETLDHLGGALYLTTRIDGFECPAFV
jgi:hypothetical protein